MAIGTTAAARAERATRRAATGGTARQAMAEGKFFWEQILGGFPEQDYSARNTYTLEHGPTQSLCKS